MSLKCGPKCPSYMDIDCSRNPDQSDPCTLAFKDLTNLAHGQDPLK